MEENLDSINESSKKLNDPLKKDIIDLDSTKEKSTLINTNSQDSNKQNIGNDNSIPLKIKPKKELPIEKKPFNEFINDHLLPSIIHEFKVRGLVVADINLKNTSRPIAGDKCWVIFCEIKDICNFWLSFEKEDISSLKSLSLIHISEPTRR